jgi:hypothetical protein
VLICRQIIAVEGGSSLYATDTNSAINISSATFDCWLLPHYWKGSDVSLTDVGVNPTRDGFLPSHHGNGMLMLSC